MKVNHKNKRDISFNGFYNNKALKKGLEFAAKNGTLFAATTTLTLSTIRPIAIMATPNTDKKNKQIASAKSITSTVTGYLIALACSRPLSRSIKNIDKNPEKYINTATIGTLKEGKKALIESKAYAMATQLFKLGLGFLIAAPKAIITAFCTPYLVNIFDNKKLSQPNNLPQNSEINFKRNDKLAKKIGEIIDNKKFQNFVIKNKDSNFPMHIVAATDTLSTATFVHQTAKSKQLENKDKKPLIYNSIIASTLSIASTYLIDFFTKDNTNKFIEKFTQANKNDPKLSQHIEGIKIAKPILIAGCIYYIIIPIISTFAADRINKK